MQFAKSGTSHAEAAEAVARLNSFWPRLDAIDPPMFLAGVIELLTTYPPAVVARAQSVTRGLPARFIFWPRIAEIKTVMDEWAHEEWKHRETVERWSRPALPAPCPLSEDERRRIGEGLRSLSEHLRGVSQRLGRNET